MVRCLAHSKWLVRRQPPHGHLEYPRFAAQIMIFRTFGGLASPVDSRPTDRQSGRFGESDTWYPAPARPPAGPDCHRAAPQARLGFRAAECVGMWRCLDGAPDRWDHLGLRRAGSVVAFATRLHRASPGVSPRRVHAPRATVARHAARARVGVRRREPSRSRIASTSRSESRPSA